MKKFHLFLVLLFLFVGSNPLKAQIPGVNVDTLTDPQIFTATCDETEYYQVYRNSTAILLDNFRNTGSSPLYLWRFQVRTTGNYLLYNRTTDSKYPMSSALVTWNRPLVETTLGWRINPGQTIRHLTTYEENGSPVVTPAWTLGSPFTASADGKIFNNANIRNPGTIPSVATSAPAYDDEVRILTEYDSDNNDSTMGDARIVVECARYNIRWCGDGLRTHGEVCDPADTSHTGWGAGGCDTSCQPVNLSACVPGTTTGPRTTPVTATTPGLCPAGQTVGGFTANTVGTTTNYTWSCDGSAVGGACSASYDSSVVTPGNFDLSIKKYAKSEDVFASVDNTENFNYTIVVRNNGTGAVTGTTTVRDTLPAPITLRATPSGNDWTCTGAAGSADFTCTTNKSYPANTEFDVITVPVQVSGLAFRPTGYVNYAYVQNPNEADGKQCNADSSMPNPTLGGVNGETPTAVCNEDKNNFDPATVNPPNPTGFDLRIKKFVNGDDESAPVRPGTTALYTFTVQNLGALASSGTTTVTDTDFPAGISIASIASTQGDWSCTQLSATGFSCTMNRSLAAGEYASTISLTANIGAPMVPGTYRNIVCLSNPYDPNEGTVLDPSTGKYKVNNCDPAEVVIVPPGTFDLSIKKYVADITTGTAQRDGDHQTTNDGTDVDRDILSISQGGSVRYRFVVRNEGPVTATGTTTVEDTLPNGFTITGSVVGAGWTCISGANGNRSFTCTRTEDLAVGSSFPEIVVNAISASAILAGEYSNTATVKNPGDTNPANNTDPANVEIIVGVPSCGTLTGSNVGDVSPGTTVNYTCTALNYTGALTNLQYQINCGTATGSWQSSNTGSCVAPTTSSTTMPVTCGVRDITNPTLLFSGSLVGSCRTAVTTTGGGSSGGPSHIGKICVNGVASCAYYNSLASCTAAGVPADKCYSADASGLALCQAQSLSCGGGGGGGGYCGDGVLGSSAGEECDLGGSNSDAPNSVCSSTCKVRLFTNPGANPITDLWMTIPVLSKTKLGYSWLDGIPGKIPFSANGVVIGRGGKVFTLADTVGFGIKTRYAIPLMIEADKEICLSGSGNVDSTILCTTFGEAASISSGIQVFTRLTDGKKYVIIGRGDYQYQNAVGGTYFAATSTSANNIDLFKGSKQYQLFGKKSIGPTLNSAYQGGAIGDASISLILPESGIDLATLPVRVSPAIVGTTGTPVNRNIETFVRITPASIVTSFLSSVRSSTTTSATTTSTSVIQDISVNGIIGYPSGIVASMLSQIPALNSNQNIRALKGDLTINCPTVGSPFVMEGVRTVIVEGNIIFNCNTAYANVNSSWAWIAKGGDIVISNGDGSVTDKGITNLAGVYLTIPSNSIGGRFIPRDNRTTTAILKIDGSLYGNANPLFDSRLYARGTSAYDILTTGTIITYSNRALVNPPPLLSQYLNNYNVERVVK